MPRLSKLLFTIAMSLPPQISLGNWEVLAESALAEKGAATNVKITLVGRPSKVMERKDADEPVPSVRDNGRSSTDHRYRNQS